MAAEIGFDLARALADEPRERAQAKSLAAAALRFYRAREAATQTERIEGWLREQLQ